MRCALALIILAGVRARGRLLAHLLQHLGRAGAPGGRASSSSTAGITSTTPSIRRSRACCSRSGPYLAGAHSFGTPPPDGTQEGKDILYSGGHYERYLTLARAGTLPFLVLLLLATWLWARRLFGSAVPRLLAVLLLVSVPPMLGHAALATLDVAAAATILLALYTLAALAA